MKKVGHESLELVGAADLRQGLGFVQPPDLGLDFREWANNSADSVGRVGGVAGTDGIDYSSKNKISR
jgi:hypothetical protein